MPKAHAGCSPLRGVCVLRSTALLAIVLASCAAKPRDIPYEQIRSAIDLVVLEKTPGVFAAFTSRDDPSKFAQVMLRDDGLLHLNIPLRTIDAWPGDERILVWQPARSLPQIDGTVTEELPSEYYQPLEEYFAARGLDLQTRVKVAYLKKRKPGAAIVAYECKLRADASFAADVIVGLMRDAYGVPAATRFDITLALGGDDIAFRSDDAVEKSADSEESPIQDQQ